MVRPLQVLPDRPLVQRWTSGESGQDGVNTKFDFGYNLAIMPYYVIEIRAESEAYPPVGDLASFLYDLGYAYDLARLATDPAHSAYVFSEESLSRENRPISADQQLHVIKLRHESPLDLMAAVMAGPAAVGAVWGLVQVIDKVANFPLNREIAKLTRDKLKKDLATTKANESEQETRTEAKMKGTVGDMQIDFRRVLHDRGEAEFLLDDVLERLEKSRLRIVHFDFKQINTLPSKRSNRRDPASR